MGSAYVPGLSVNRLTTLRLERRLPLAGKVLVSPGERVRWNQAVASTYLPGGVDMVNVAGKLGLEPSEVPECMLVKQGESVVKGAGLARSKGFFGLFKSTLESPVSGVVESVSGVSGQVVLRAPSVLVQTLAYVDGVVAQVLGDEGVVISTQGAYIQGIFGIGGETAGELVMLAENPDQVLEAAAIKPEHRGKIVVCGALATLDILESAVEHAVSAVIVGGLDDKDLRDFLGYDLGVAITGSEDKKLSLLVTEGFGRLPIAERTWSILKENQGRLASLSGATQIRAGVIRPELIVPKLDEGELVVDKAQESGESFVVGANVRVIREPHFGQLATVIKLPASLAEIPTGARVRVAEIQFADGSNMTIPRANLELIEL